MVYCVDCKEAINEQETLHGDCMEIMHVQVVAHTLHLSEVGHS